VNERKTLFVKPISYSPTMFSTQPTSTLNTSKTHPYSESSTIPSARQIRETALHAINESRNLYISGLSTIHSLLTHPTTLQKHSKITTKIINLFKRMPGNEYDYNLGEVFGSEYIEVFVEEYFKFIWSSTLINLKVSCLSATSDSSLELKNIEVDGRRIEYNWYALERNDGIDNDVYDIFVKTYKNIEKKLKKIVKSELKESILKAPRQTQRPNNLDPINSLETARLKVDKSDQSKHAPNNQTNSLKNHIAIQSTSKALRLNKSTSRKKHESNRKAKEGHSQNSEHNHLSVDDQWVLIKPLNENLSNKVKTANSHETNLISRFKATIKKYQELEIKNQNIHLANSFGDSVNPKSRIPIRSFVVKEPTYQAKHQPFIREKMHTLSEIEGIKKRITIVKKEHPFATKINQDLIPHRTAGSNIVPFGKTMKPIVKRLITF